MRFTKQSEFDRDLQNHWQDVLKNKSTVKDKDLKEFYSEEMILATVLRNEKIIFDAVKGRSFSNYLKLLRALGKIIQDNNIDTVNRFDIMEGGK